MKKRSSWASGRGKVPSYSTGILRGQDKKRPFQPMRHPVHRHLALAHRLQQRRLRARRGPVDFVGQQNVGEDGARHKRKAPAFADQK
jgi:hypothetical protein